MHVDVRCRRCLALAMSEQMPASPLPPHVIGTAYDLQTIRKDLGGEDRPPHFVIHRDNAILGLCLGLMWNPLAEGDPAEVWVGRKGDLPKWGLTLAATTGPLPVYVRREEGGPWYFIGLREVAGNTDALEEIRRRLKPPVITAISRIVFLKRCEGATAVSAEASATVPSGL
jgi:hypothetical protein